jgi:signal peptidase I
VPTTGADLPPDGCSPPEGRDEASEALSRVALRHQRASRRRARFALEVVAVLVVALVTAFLMERFVIQAYYIPSGSMEPTLMVGDRVIVSKLSYHLHPIHRGDIVVFDRPATDNADPSISHLIKRVIGLPGDTVQGVNGQIFVDGRLLREPYLPSARYPADRFPPVRVPPGDIFVMGDNRDNSDDSRVFGPIPEKDVVGRAVLRIWPLTSIGLL